jgi:hypothetical protein
MLMGFGLGFDFIETTAFFASVFMAGLRSGPCATPHPGPLAAGGARGSELQQPQFNAYAGVRGVDLLKSQIGCC